MPDKKRGPEICKMMTLGTIHLSPKTRQTLDEEPDANRIGLTMYAKAGFGWYVHVDDTAICAMDVDVLDSDYPELADCIRLAVANGCKLLCFDCDAEPVDGLPVYPCD